METGLEGTKVVRAEEMARIEKVSMEAGASAEAYMLKAGEGVAQRIEAFVKERGLEKVVTLLVGKGNNGGDALVAGNFLLHRGFHVEAFRMVSLEEASPLCQKHGKGFDGKWQDVLKLKGVIVDGLLGTGFQGTVEGKLRELIQQVNASKLPVLSIDIPSGVNGNTGEADCAIVAEETLYLGMAKRGFFVGKGYNHVGKLCRVDFGMDPKYYREAQGVGYLIREEALKALLPPLQRDRHKYQAGYVIAIAGSPGMPGAAMLSCLAALRTGAGIVRLFHPEGMEKELAPAAYELVRTPYRWGEDQAILEEGKRAKGCLMGPGVGKGEEMHTFLQGIASKLHVPMVIDADALYHLKIFPKGAILTPHTKEMLHLLGQETLTHEACQAFVDQSEVTLVLKGAPTWIFHPKTLPLIVPKGDPGMATAGTGDVLTGMIAALLAQGVKGRNAAALGVYLHGSAGEIAARKKTSYDMIASDLIEALPAAFQSLLGQSPPE
ncbi:MAG: NAD(P)H-hydrate dehydratase [Chlamydiia bacterium]|nr:NAD(P)H-hydrate dehydratase [Chlamydiia bacterium]